MEAHRRQSWGYGSYSSFTPPRPGAYTSGARSAFNSPNFASGSDSFGVPPQSGGSSQHEDPSSDDDTDEIGGEETERTIRIWLSSLSMSVFHFLLVCAAVYAYSSFPRLPSLVPASGAATCERVWHFNHSSIVCAPSLPSYPVAVGAEEQALELAATPMGVVRLVVGSQWTWYMTVALMGEMVVCSLLLFLFALVPRVFGTVSSVVASCFPSISRKIAVVLSQTRVDANLPFFFAPSPSLSALPVPTAAALAGAAARAAAGAGVSLALQGAVVSVAGVAVAAALAPALSAAVNGGEMTVGSVSLSLCGVFVAASVLSLVSSAFPSRFPVLVHAASLPPPYTSSSKYPASSRAEAWLLEAWLRWAPAAAAVAQGGVSMGVCLGAVASVASALNPVSSSPGGDVGGVGDWAVLALAMAGAWVFYAPAVLPKKTAKGVSM